MNGRTAKAGWSVILTMCGVMAAGPAAAQLSEPALRNGYDYAVRCFAVAPIARRQGLGKDGGEAAFRAAYTFGTKLGYTSDQVGQDVKARTKVELEKMYADAAYLKRALNDCSRLGLL